MSGNVSRPGATVTGRALAILAAFDDRHRRLSLTELAARAELPLPTCHRLAGELLAWGALSRTPTGHFVIGRRLWDVGMLAPVQAGLQQAASPFLNDLHAATRATVHLAVRDDLEVLYVERLSGRVSVPVVSRAGSRLPLHATGVGKVLLAHAPPDVVERALARLTRQTPYTVTQPGRLREQLAKVREEGYATTVEEMTLGACSIAVPVRGRDLAGDGDPLDRPVLAALGIVVPNLKRERGRLLSALQVAAQGIGRSLA